jgi:multiple sugar transport system permease protein
MHMNSSRTLSYALTYLVLGFFALTVLVPMLWATGTSLKTYGEVFSRPLAFVPDVPQWDNYAEIFRIAPFARYFVNTVIVSLFVCLITLLTSAMSAYAFARLKFPGRETIFVLYLATMMIPQQVILIPNFVIIREMGLIDSLTALILTRSFLPLGTFLLRQFFMGIPQELEEAAVIDGLGYTKRFVSIILPLAKPALVSLLIITLLLAWNDYLYPLVFIQSDSNRTLTLGLSILQGDLDIRWNLVLAATLVTVAPLVVVYLALQRFFIEGIALSGTKG